MIDSQCIAQMEDLLELYERPYNSQYPVICLDERTCQLLGDVVTPLPIRPKSVRKEDYEYKRKEPVVRLLLSNPQKANVSSESGIIAQKLIMRTL